MTVPEHEQLFASKLAYADLDEAYANLKRNPPVTLQKAIDYAVEHGSNLGSFSDCLENGKLKKEYDFANDWCLLEPVNENTENGSGLYACIIDTGDANILACRGSEEMTELANYRQDWYGADMKLLNSEMTAQEEALKNYIDKHKDELNSKPWVSTGHSLGGALADYAAIHSVELGLDNYSGTYNFDGPGHSQEFIEKYSDEIAQICDRMIHIRASFVGSILYDLPGVPQVFIETNVDGVIDKHFMKNWKTENGSLVVGEQGYLEYLVEKLTRGIDRLPPFVGNSLVQIINVMIEGVFWAKSFMDDHPYLMQLITVGTFSFMLMNPYIVGISALSIVSLALVVVDVLLLVAIGEIIIEVMEELIYAAIDAVCKAVSWLKDKATELYQAAKKLIANVKEYFHNLNPGARYASNHPEFRADTGLMREYANRLRAVNGRLTSLDRDLDDLYWQVGLLDVYDILKANIIAGYSPRIGLCQNYLNKAADALEDADRKALGYMGG